MGNAVCKTCKQDGYSGRLNGYDECYECCTKRQKAQAERIAAEQPKIELNVGDVIRIITNGRMYEGSVLSAQNYGRDSGWYIEFQRTPASGGYGYWKQGSDGGVVRKVS